MNCSCCKSLCIKKGKQKDIQTYYCKTCNKYQQAIYKQKRFANSNDAIIKQLHNEGMGIRSMARIIKVSATTIVRKIKWLSLHLPLVKIQEEQQVYEIDEMKSRMAGDKDEGWVVIAMNRKTKQVVANATGRRNKETIGKVVKEVLTLNPRRIVTDGLNTYSGLIPRNLHTVCKTIMFNIERMHLTLRTHLKRLSRETICFSRNKEMLENAVKLYFS